MVIYKITNLLSGKIYIGQTVQSLEDRWSDHSRPARGRHKNKSAIGSAIRKYGKENFFIEKIDSAGSIEALGVLEAHYIQKYGSLAPAGYNLELGGDSKRCHEETKAKIREALKGRPFVNRWAGGNRSKRTDAQKAHLSSLIKGRPNVALYKRVLCVETGAIYESVNAAAASHKCNRVTMSGLLKSGKRNSRGFTFQYA